MRIVGPPPEVVERVVTARVSKDINVAYIEFETDPSQKMTPYTSVVVNDEDGEMFIVLDFNTAGVLAGIELLASDKTLPMIFRE